MYLSDKLTGTAVDAYGHPDRKIYAVSFRDLYDSIFKCKLYATREIKIDLVSLVGKDQSVLGIFIDRTFFFAVGHKDIPAFFTAGILSLFVNDVA